MQVRFFSYGLHSNTMAIKMISSLDLYRVNINVARRINKCITAYCNNNAKCSTNVKCIKNKRKKSN